jgi:hypothetical protein
MPQNAAVRKIAKVYNPTNRQQVSVANIKQIRRALATNIEICHEDLIKTSTIVGWSEESSETFYMKRRMLQIERDVIPYTNTIFPVIVEGEDEDPVRDFVLRLRLPGGYTAGNYLVLRYYMHKKRETKRIIVHKQGEQFTYEALTYSGSLQYFLVHVKRDGRCLARKVGNVECILDIDSTCYFVYGMYAGGPLPHGVRGGRGRNRITWDQPRARYELAGFGSMRAGFRNDIDFQRFSQRVRFFLCQRRKSFCHRTKRMESSDT